VHAGGVSWTWLPGVSKLIGHAKACECAERSAGLKHSIELRDLSADKIAAWPKKFGCIAKQTNTEITIAKVEHDPPAMATPEIQSQIKMAATGLGL